MAIRDRITIKFKSGGKAFVSEVRRPGGTVDAQYEAGFFRVVQFTRKGQIVDWAMYSGDEIKSVEFERGA